MKFDLGEVLTRAIQITWRHKVLWGFGALPVLVSFLIFPFMFIPLFLGSTGVSSSNLMETPLFVIIFVILMIFISLFSYGLYGISSSAIILGTLRADAGSDRLSMRGLYQDSRPYWFRVLGVLLLIGLGIGLVFFGIFGCMSLFGAVTAGIGFICVMPFYLLIYPLMMVLYSVIEESQAAVVVDDINATDAIRRGWDVVRENFWGIVLISLVVYFGISLLSAIVMFPLMSPMFLIPFLMDTRGTEFNSNTLLLILGGFSLFFVPVMALVQGIGITFMKSTYTLLYIRIRKARGGNEPVHVEMDAHQGE